MMADTPFFTMTGHGHARRDPHAGGCLILSKLHGGSSLIEARAPSLKFVLGGEEAYEIRGRKRVLRPGQFMLVEAGQDVAVRTSRSEDSIGLCIYFHCVGDAEPAGDLVREAIVFGTGSGPLATLLDSSARRLWERPEEGRAVAAPLVQEVSRRVDAFLSDMSERADRLTSAKRSTRIETLRRVERARCFLEEHADKAVALEEIARYAALSRFHLTRAFSDVHGVPPLAYHRRLRLDAAARKLRAGSHSPTVLADDLGYSDLSAFTRAFRQQFGVPPSRAATLDERAMRLE